MLASYQLQFLELGTQGGGAMHGGDERVLGVHGGLGLVMPWGQATLDT